MVKHLVFMLCLIIAVRSQIDSNEKDYNKTRIYKPDGNGKPSPENRDVVTNNIQFEFYDKGQKVAYDYKVDDYENSRNNRNNLKKITQKFNPKWDTKILVNGWWWSDTKSEFVKIVSETYAKRGKINIFTINWGEYASYADPVKSTALVGRAVAKLIDVLVEIRKADQKRIHLIGHGSGAHVMGFAGSYTKHRVGRITGLDPAGRDFEGLVGPENYLDRTDALLVDVIHTTAGSYGFIKSSGHADFYPNNGASPQPGCWTHKELKIPVCSHRRSYEYYVESINSPKGFQATTCQVVQSDTCEGPKILMGDPMPTTVRGLYYLETSETAPFALGNVVGCLCSTIK